MEGRRFMLLWSKDAGRVDGIKTMVTEEVCEKVNLMWLQLCWFLRRLC